MLAQNNKVKLATLSAGLEVICDMGHTPFIAVNTRHSEYRGITQTEHPDGIIVLDISVNAVRDFFMDEQGVSFSYTVGGSKGQAYIPMDSLVSVFAKEDINILLAFPEKKVDIEPEAVKVPTKPVKKTGFKPRIITGGKK